MAVNIMIVMILVACGPVTGDIWEMLRKESLEQKGVLQTLTQQQTVLQKESLEQKEVLQNLTQQQTVLQKESLEQWGVLQNLTGVLQQESAILRQNFSTLLRNYARDITTNIKHVVSGTPFSTCKGEPVISLTGTKIKYPATGKYNPYEECQWTIDAGNVTLSFAHFDLEVDGTWDYVEIWSGGSMLYQLDQARYKINPDFSTTLDGVITIKFISDQNMQYTGFEMNINAGH